MREIEVPMPKLSMTMEEGELIAWVKKEGEQVRAGDVICEVNSDKVEMEVESPADGTLVRFAAAEGDIVPVGAPIATLATEAEDLLGGVLGPAGGDGAAATPAAETPAPTTEPAAPPDAATAPAPPAGGPKPVVPAARRRAAELGVDLAAVTGTGPDGLVRVGDVEAAAAPQPTPAAAPAAAVSVTSGADVEELPVSAMRRVVARRLVESMQSTPHFYLTITVDAEALVGFRAELNQQLADRGDDLKVSLNDLIVKACAVLLAANPELNVSWGGDKLLVHKRVHVGIAVAVSGGLVVPVIRDADHKTLTQVAREARELAGRARAGRLAAGEMGGGTFTVSNLGMFGIDQFTAVINPPEAAILAVGAALAEPVVGDGGAVVVRRRMRLTLSIDHRALDGATGAQFLAQLKTTLEHPLQIIA
ncbi:MAG TPA: dihydrolipoamide acetyltransferase family protein [Actinomycetes bacterium]|nr:dihydrolipoamide acetyltransferase family protein [Actinomycetes bacterium]